MGPEAGAAGSSWARVRGQVGAGLPRTPPVAAQGKAWCLHGAGWGRTRAGTPGGGGEQGPGDRHSLEDPRGDPHEDGQGGLPGQRQTWCQGAGPAPQVPRPCPGLCPSLRPHPQARAPPLDAPVSPAKGPLRCGRGERWQPPCPPDPAHLCVPGQFGPCFLPHDRPHWPRGSPNFRPFLPTTESGTGQTELLAPRDHV